MTRCNFVPTSKYSYNQTVCNKQKIRKFIEQKSFLQVEVKLISIHEVKHYLIIHQFNIIHCVHYWREFI